MVVIKKSPIGGLIFGGGGGGVFEGAKLTKLPNPPGGFNPLKPPRWI